MAHNERDRRRDAAGIGPYARDAERLVRLHDMGGWNVADGEPDIRGWEVRTIGGRELGKVTELLVDPDAGEVVMLDVDLSGSDRRALVPLRIVEIDRHRRVVRMDSADITPLDAEKAEEAIATHADEALGSAPAAARDRTWAETGHVRYPGHDREVVVERRPMVEEVVVRRRAVDTGAEDEQDRPADETPEAEQRSEPTGRPDA